MIDGLGRVLSMGRARMVGGWGRGVRPAGMEVGGTVDGRAEGWEEGGGRADMGLDSEAQGKSRLYGRPVRLFLARTTDGERSITRTFSTMKQRV